jgi:SAM-dependent methyltransferase
MRATLAGDPRLLAVLHRVDPQWGGSTTAIRGLYGIGHRASHGPRERECCCTAMIVGMPSSIPFDRIADRYDVTRGGEGRARHTAAAFEPWLVPGPIIELGVGTGLISAALAGDGRQPIGIDLARPMLTRAADRLPGRVVQGDVLMPPLRPRAAAVVVAVHVLHLVGDLAGAVAATAALLRPGGRFLISGIDGDRQSDDELVALDGDVSMRLRPIRPPSVDDIVDVASAHGLRCLHDGHMPRRTFTQSPASAAGLLESRAWSWCWELSDDVWAAEIVPVINNLRALPDPERPRERWIEWRYLVLERKESS